MRKICLIIVVILIANVTTGHSQWSVLQPTVLDSGAEDYGYNCVFLNADTGIIQTGRGLAFTSDGGTTWSLDSALPPNNKEISFLSINVGFIDNDGPYSFYKTTDMGLDWQLDSNKSQALQDLSGTSIGSAFYFQDSLDGWEGYQNFSIFATTDGGNTWEIRHLETDSTLDLSFFTVEQIVFCNRALGIALVDNGNRETFILRTTDGGISWQNISVDYYHPIASGTPTGLVYTDPHHAFFCTDHYELLKSTDSGLTWSNVDVPAISARFQSMSFADSNHGILAAGDAGTIAIYTFDGGVTWQADTLSRYNLCAASFPDTSVAYVTSGYSLFRLSTANLAVRPVAQVTTAPSMELEGGILSVIMPDGSGDRLQIVDILGRELLSSIIPPDGTLKLDISSLPSGVYFISDGHSRAKFVKE